MTEAPNSIAKSESAGVQVSDKAHRSNVRIALACLGFFGGMVGLSYASVPLYQLFCQVTGYGGTTQRAEAAPVQVLDQKIKVRFDANIGGSLGWEFAPVERQVELKVGEVRQVGYVARNRLDFANTGSATFNVTPQAAGAYFNKMECFCFTETTLSPDESLDMPVVFFIDPDIVDAPELKDISTITLSYTFFPVEGAETSQMTTSSEDIGITADDRNLDPTRSEANIRG